MFNIEDRTPVVHGETGFLIKEDVGELVALLDWINTNRGDLTDISYQARKIVESEYDNCIIMERLAKVYHSLVAR
jgi:glycosyltransferase involved in cell wall biosynthesis